MRMRLEKQCNLLVNGSKTSDVDLFPKKISEVFIICFKNVGAKNSAVFISCKVTYRNILFF